MEKNYNVFSKSINTALSSEPVGTAGGYIALLAAPTNANVKIHLNDRNADGIPLKAYHAIEATNIEKIFVSSNAVANETITIVQAFKSEDFKMITPASDVNVDTINTLNDRFRPSGTAIEQEILNGAFYLFTKTNETQIRFHCTDETGVELDANGVKYPMFEEELYLDNLATVKFYNDTGATQTLKIWSM